MASLRLNLNLDNQFGRVSTLQSAASTSVSVGFECGFTSCLSSSSSFRTLRSSLWSLKQRSCSQTQFSSLSICAAIQPLDLTEDNVRRVLADARTELAQIFDTSVGITGEAELVEVDGPFVKISLRGRFWHERSMVLARLGNYLRQRIPEILEVDIEDEKQLDDSPENF